MARCPLSPAAATANAEWAARWVSALYGEQPTLTLSGVADDDNAALAYLTPLDDECWQVIAELPPLEDGPVRLTFPAVPLVIAARLRT